ncbi:hypothetical protein FisN_10Hu324 [Fistulifera solaris]|jgi:hypothetical protein|uniref:Uncharacterized protein n=1 Tax=Fistulifera solaris TaxID=1519565 RepID=A0A1Z5K5C6_FISSO|nr:hypothetical protein FisN_10Hu324 [Fistulifera solaris]|eukprot:GAX21188.1 hypothetical protein FisN_10Hu324 [Fistulifera solaris]
MQVSTQFDAALSINSHVNSSAPEKRAESPEQTLRMSHEPAVESRYDNDALVVSGAVFSEEERREDIMLALTSPIETNEVMRRSRERLMSSVHEIDFAECDTASIAASSVLSNESDLTSLIQRRVRRVTFAPELVTSVIEISSCFSMSVEEKQRLYTDKLTLEAEANKSAMEVAFEGSFRCIENVFEEDMFFHNHLGELIHPAHFLPYSRGALLTEVRPGTSVPGFSSWRVFMYYMLEYARFYDAAKLHGIFHSTTQP